MCRINENISRLRRQAFGVFVVLFIVGYWMLPIHGQLIILTDRPNTRVSVWPQIWVDPPAYSLEQDITIYVRDNVGWGYIKLLANGKELLRDESYPSGNDPWTWRWHMKGVTADTINIVFYHSCHTGCVKRGQMTIGTPPLTMNYLIPTKLGVVFPSEQRNWHGRSGWSVLLTYAQRQHDDVDFSIDGLAQKVYQSTVQGQRVIVRVAYDHKQALPPTGDEIALARFLEYCTQLARDDRLDSVYAFAIGAAFNTAQENSLAPTQPTTPEWYARVFNGYGIAVDRSDNVTQVMRSIDPKIRILVGAVTPWATDQNGAIKDPYDVPWLNYMNSLVAYLDISVRLHLERGIPFTAPDGFAIRAAGRIDASEVANQPSNEPSQDIHYPKWGKAQVGFRVYRDWLAIVNRYSTTQGLPVYIISINTIITNLQQPPAQNYPTGWLTTALTEVNLNPQIQALCWFVDDPMDGLWKDYSLQESIGNLHDASREFDELLQHR